MLSAAPWRSVLLCAVLAQRCASWKPVCPPCAPKARPKLDIVVPFYWRDLCKLKVSLKSWLWRDPEHILGDVYLIWSSDESMAPYQDDITALKWMVQYFNKSFHVVDFAPLIKEARQEMLHDPLNNSYTIEGWYAQQVAKLKAASLVRTEFYVVMDSKNTLIVDLEAPTLLSRCNQGVVSADFRWSNLPSPHGPWYQNAAELLHVTPDPTSIWPASVSPLVMHRPTVLAALAAIGEAHSITKLCQGPLCRLLGKFRDDERITEFALYVTFARLRSPSECTHFFYFDPAIVYGGTGTGIFNVWRGRSPVQSGFHRQQAVTAIATGLYHCTFFGFQHGALDDMSPERRALVAGTAAKFYKKVGLYNFASVEDFVECLAGSKDTTTKTATSTGTTTTLRGASILGVEAGPRPVLCAFAFFTLLAGVLGIHRPRRRAELLQAEPLPLE